jgi:type II restriction/modification system DNA methylase subunit YeeA
LDAAYNQLLQYVEALEYPDLLVTCDMMRLVIHTNFRGLPRQQHEIQLGAAALGEVQERVVLDQLRDLFNHPERFKPGETIEQITRRAAGKLGAIAETMGKRYEPTAVARFLDRIVFCLFAEDIDLLPHNLFSKLLAANRYNPARFSKLIGDLFGVMATGGDFGEHYIRQFNGNLFNEELRFELSQSELDAVREAALMDWKNVDPSIFGTLFERGLDPNKRSQLGAHYTSREDIETLVEPVVLQPLRREWQAAREQIEELSKNRARERADSGALPDDSPLADARGSSARSDARAIDLVRGFLARLGEVRVLDPACGSGNFLYVALQKLKDLEKSVLVYAHDNALGDYAPTVSPDQLYGIELNPYAYDLAQTTVWIGYLQWLRDNGFLFTEEPVLRKSDNIRNMDAVLDVSGASTPTEPQWPEVDFIVGNPPFLGGSKLWEELGREYQQQLWSVYKGRVPGFADLCCYWFEKARRQIEEGKCKRAGLLATQAIRGGANREVLARIKETGDIFFGVSDSDWVLNGANVHISMAGFDSGEETNRVLDGQPVAAINANLTALSDVTLAQPLKENKALCFMGPSPKAPFDISEKLALGMLGSPNPTGAANSDVTRPVASAVDLVGKNREQWTLDFASLSFDDAINYAAPFAYLKTTVFPVRGNNPKQNNSNWWQYERPRIEMRKALTGLSRFLVTPAVAKHRIFVWHGSEYLCNQGTLVFARDDDYFFGVLHSRLHEVWSLRLGTRLEDRPRYTPTTCFETFPFPQPTSEQREAIADAAKVLDTLRSNWLSPSEWTREEVLEFPGSVDGPWARYVHDADSRGIGIVRYPRRVAKDAILAKNLVRRTLTNLYNERPAWLDNAHRKLDAAVLAAYGWELDLSDEQILEKLLALNLAS